MKSKLLFSALVALSMLALQAQGQAQKRQPVEVATTTTAGSEDPQAETAREAYEEEDAQPVENWFGCPPADKDDGAVAQSDEPAATVTVTTAEGTSVTKLGEKPGADAEIQDNCDPEAPRNDSPQKEDDRTS